jgi:hypothetical protein
MRAAQKAADRRRTIILIVVAVVVGLGLIAAAVVPIVMKNRENSKPIADIGVSAAAADCGDVIDDVATGSNDHVGAGTDRPDITEVTYETNPPSSGKHFAVPAGIDRHIYTADDVPPVEQLVHNLEHGYTVVWYDSTLDDSQIDELKALADRVSVDTPKFIVAAWDESRGDFPEGHIAMSHWSTDNGHRQYCGDVSGEAVESFITQFPYTDAPEPNAM